MTKLLSICSYLFPCEKLAYKGKPLKGVAIDLLLTPHKKDGSLADIKTTIICEDGAIRALAEVFEVKLDKTKLLTIQKNTCNYNLWCAEKEWRDLAYQVARQKLITEQGEIIHLDRYEFNAFIRENIDSFANELATPFMTGSIPALAYVHIPIKETLMNHVEAADSRAMEKVKSALEGEGYDVYVKTIDKDRDIPLQSDALNIVICGPKHSKTVADFFRECEGVCFERNGSGEYEITDNEAAVLGKEYNSSNIYGSQIDDPVQYAFLGTSVPIRTKDFSENIVLAAGIHSSGSERAVDVYIDHMREASSGENGFLIKAEAGYKMDETEEPSLTLDRRVKAGWYIE